MPFGCPEIDHVYGCVPPVAVMACCAEYPVPTIAVGGLNPVLVIDSAALAGATVRANTLVAIC
jgi:hypothetical protein